MYKEGGAFRTAVPKQQELASAFRTWKPPLVLRIEPLAAAVMPRRRLNATQHLRVVLAIAFLAVTVAALRVSAARGTAAGGGSVTSWTNNHYQRKLATTDTGTSDHTLEDEASSNYN